MSLLIHTAREKSILNDNNSCTFADHFNKFYTFCPNHRIIIFSFKNKVFMHFRNALTTIVHTPWSSADTTLCLFEQTYIPFHTANKMLPHIIALILQLIMHSLSFVMGPRGEFLFDDCSLHHIVYDEEVKIRYEISHRHI